MEPIQELISRLERMRGPFMGDGVNPGFTTTEVLAYLKLAPTPKDPIGVETYQQFIERRTKELKMKIKRSFDAGRLESNTRFIRLMMKTNITSEMLFRCNNA